MKKISFIALAGLLAVACAKSPVDLEIHTSPVIPEEVAEIGRTANITLYASVDRDEDTKMSASENGGYVEFNFDEGDQISTFFVSGEKKDVNVKFTFIGGKFVSDEGQLYTTLDGEPDVYGIYPYEKGMSEVADLTKVPVTIPQVQMYDPGRYKENGNLRYPKDYCHFAAVPTTLVPDGDDTYTIETKFYTMGSMIKFNVQNNTGEELAVRSVNIYGAPGLSGDFTANLTETPEYGNEDFKLEPVEGGNQYNHVCVSFGNDGFALGNKYKMPLYAFVNAVDFDHSTDGFSMTVSTDKGTYEAIFEDRTADGFARNTRYTYTVTLDSGRKIDDEYVARYSNDGGSTWTKTKSLKRAIYEIEKDKLKLNGIVELLKDETITNIAGMTGTKCYITDNKNFTLNGNGFKLDISGRESSAFTYNKAGNPCDIEIQDIVIFEDPDVNKEAPLTTRFLYMNSADAKIKLGKGVVVDGVVNGGTTGGGAVYVGEGGTLTIDGATISNCQSTVKSGGAILNYGTINFISGKISNCSSGANGGAIYTSGTMKMTGGLITGCSISSTTASNYGGGVANYGKCDILGGVIENCSAVASGSGNYAYAGGVYHTSGGTMNIENAKIINCSCANGSNICAYSGTLNLKSGSLVEINESQAKNSAMIYLRNTAEVNVYSGAILQNSVRQVLRISAANAKLNIYGGKISSSSASDTDYPAVAAENGNMTITGGTIETTNKVSALKVAGATVNVEEAGEIKSTSSGYPVFVSAGSFNVKGGLIQSEASQVIYVKNEKADDSYKPLAVTFTGGDIHSNATKSSSKYNLYVSEMGNGTDHSIKIKGGYFITNYRCIYSAANNATSVEISCDEGTDEINEPHFYSYDNSGSSDTKVILFSKSTSGAKTYYGWGVYGCATTDTGSWAVNGTLSDGRTTKTKKAGYATKDDLIYMRHAVAK